VELFELEAAVGRLWHRWAGRAASYPSHPEAAVSLAAQRARLAVFFRALGGSGGVRLASVAASGSGHRLRLRQRLGLGGVEPLAQAVLDAETLQLPACIDCFPDPALNERLYFWLAAFFAHASPLRERPADALQADVARLRAAHQASQRALAEWPGLRATHARLGEALRGVRPARALPPWEQAMEATIGYLLGGAPPQDEAGQRITRAVTGDGELAVPCPRGYRSFLPVPLWGEVRPGARSATAADADSAAPQPGKAIDAAEQRYRAARRRADQASRRDSLIFNRFEYLLGVAEMVNVNRHVEDDDPESARHAAEALEEVTVSQHAQTAQSRVRLDLELAPPAVETGPLVAELSYPEWDFTRRAYHAEHCRVVTPTIETAGAGQDWVPESAARRRIRAVKRQFEALRPRRERHFAQADGDELDLEAVVRSRADQAAGGSGSDRVYLQSRATARDLAVAVLMDASLSTDAWVENRRVLDVEKEAVLALAAGLEACGDDNAVLAFTSRTRREVSVATIKDFGEPLAGEPTLRLQALRPGYYTRIGAALRHATARLQERPNRRRLLLLITDGKPNDMDHYEGRYGVEDTRRAVREARRAGLAVFGITIDRRAREYFPYLFGPGGYAMVGRIGRLPAALPAIYHQITN